MSNGIFELSERKQSDRDTYEFNGRLFTLWETTNGGAVYIPVGGEKPEFYNPVFGDDVYALIVEPDNILNIDHSKQYSIGDFKRVPPVDNTDGSNVKLVEDGLYVLNNWIFRASFDNDCMEWNLHETSDRAFFVLRSSSDKKIYACGTDFTGNPYPTPWTVDDLKPCDKNGNPTEQAEAVGPVRVMPYPDYSREATFDGKISDYLEIVKAACDQAEKLIEMQKVRKPRKATRPTAASQSRRVDSKKQKSEIKQLRSKRFSND